MLIVNMSGRLIGWDKQTGLQKGVPFDTIETLPECFEVGMGPRVTMTDKDCREHLFLHLLVHMNRAAAHNISKLEEINTVHSVSI
jgi:hypothetical protein